ncbi:NF-kappa-B-repressing factor [Habropoda laboriosa]|uniref:NF-kappa-B-repressing factor n=1 Tax=Habropoda laboriosa TaxID=597456 RepID=A0A0L7QUE0_9HYME|nr:PREDICTED: NF-kappa-B-repressing factor [Habropoda laboriosa]KOC62277.1 NF-kappa-B-repressing factor [Habropoda laboriosa]
MKMNAEEDWDVERYKTEHESDEHWELKRKFLLAHKDKFPEDELICLAQVFTNIEVLGCRYPKETMQLIAELAHDIAQDYREKQKNKIQRTFVKASDAASLKVKGLTASSSANKAETGNQSQSKRASHYSKSNEVPAKHRKLQELSFGDIVIVERPGDIPQNILACAVNAAGGDLDWKFERIKDSYKCSIFINSKLLAEACSSNQKLAKKEASTVGLHELEKHYYTIKIKHNINMDANVTTTATIKSMKKEECISDDNIGKKLMKLMGWTGGGLGKLQQGIVEPIMLKQQISREGLGLKSNSCNMTDLKIKAKDIMRKYLSGDMQNDLVFSADFTSEERAAIHEVARQQGLKSHSYGPKNQRTLVVSRKINVRDLVEELKNLGGVTDKYQLIGPTGL